MKDSYILIIVENVLQNIYCELLNKQDNLEKKNEVHMYLYLNQPHGMKVVKGATPISYFLYVDKIVLFFVTNL